MLNSSKALIIEYLRLLSVLKAIYWINNLNFWNIIAGLELVTLRLEDGTIYQEKTESVKNVPKKKEKIVSLSFLSVMIQLYSNQELMSCIPKYFYRNPNVYKFEQLLNIKNKMKLIKQCRLSTTKLSWLDTVQIPFLGVFSLFFTLTHACMQYINCNDRLNTVLMSVYEDKIIVISNIFQKDTAIITTKNCAWYDSGLI